MTNKAFNIVDVWTGIISPERPDMPKTDARAVLRWKFDDRSKLRMEQLASRNSRGVMTATEREELEAYVQVGQVIAILQAKAELSLKKEKSRSPSR